MAQYGNSSGHYEMTEVGEPGLGNQGDGNDMVRFHQEADALEERCDEFRRLVDSLPSIHTRLEQAISENDILEAQKVLEQNNNAARDYSRDIINRLKALRIETANMPADSAVRRMRSNRCNTLSNRLRETLSEHRRLSSSHDRNMRSKFARQYRAVNPGATEDEIDRNISSQTGGVFAAELLMSARAEHGRQVLASAQERQQEVDNLVRSITELATMFEELQTLVNAQDEDLANIEKNVTLVNTRVEAAHNDIVEATEKARSARKKRWCLFIFFIILLLIIIGVVIYVVKSNSPK